MRLLHFQFLFLTLVFEVVVTTFFENTHTYIRIDAYTYTHTQHPHSRTHSCTHVRKPLHEAKSNTHSVQLHVVDTCHGLNSHTLMTRRTSKLLLYRGAAFWRHAMHATWTLFGERSPSHFPKKKSAVTYNANLHL